MIRNGAESKGYGHGKQNNQYQPLNVEIEVQNVKSSEKNGKIPSGISSKSTSPPPLKGENMIEGSDDGLRMFSEFDEERANFFDGSNYTNGHSRNNG